MSQGDLEPPTAPIRATHVFKVIDGREIQADVIGARPIARKPAVVWIHGGGLIFGNTTSSRASKPPPRWTDRR